MVLMYLHQLDPKDLPLITAQNIPFGLWEIFLYGNMGCSQLIFVIDGW